MDHTPAGNPRGDESWLVRRSAGDLDRLGETESIFALGNGWVGWRGNLDEGEPYGMPGTYLNGFYEHRDLTYPEGGYGEPVRVTGGEPAARPMPPVPDPGPEPLSPPGRRPAR